MGYIIIWKYTPALGPLAGRIKRKVATLLRSQSATEREQYPLRIKHLSPLYLLLKKVSQSCCCVVGCQHDENNGTGQYRPKGSSRRSAFVETHFIMFFGQTYTASLQKKRQVSSRYSCEGALFQSSASLTSIHNNNGRQKKSQ
jgi:hypothetical protein